MNKILAVALWSFCLSMASSALAGGEHMDFGVAQDGTASHMLLIEGDEDILSGAESIELELNTDPFSALNGWFTAGEPGFKSVDADDPGNGIFTLLAGNGVALVRDSFDASFAMFDPGENAILTSDGSNHAFDIDVSGGFHEDLIFGASPGTIIGSMFSATYHLTDLNGIHSDSAPFTLNFATVPEPAAGILLGVAGLVVLRRRRRIAASVDACGRHPNRAAPRNDYRCCSYAD